MKTINKDSKKGAQYLYMYERAKYESIRDCYKYGCGQEKKDAERGCKNRMEDENGRGYRIISFSQSFFAAAWITAQGLRVETVGGSYLVK